MSLRDTILLGVFVATLLLAAAINDTEAGLPPEPNAEEVAVYGQVSELGCVEDEYVVRVVAAWSAGAQTYDPDLTGTLLCAHIENTRPVTPKG